jgi:hypothetical protein
VSVYTSSQVEKFGDTLPIGVIQVPTIRAGQAGDQSPFFIDVRKRAFIPFTRQFSLKSTVLDTDLSVLPKKACSSKSSNNIS